jgi:hypothetical protein
VREVFNGQRRPEYQERKDLPWIFWQNPSQEEEKKEEGIPFSFLRLKIVGEPQSLIWALPIASSGPPVGFFGLIATREGGQKGTSDMGWENRIGPFLN